MSRIQVIDRASVPEGIFTLKVYIRGELVEDYVDKNLLVDVLKTCQAHLIAGDATNRSITKIGFGTSATAAAASDTALTGMFSRSIGAATYPNSTSVQFAWQLDTGENNGMAISEFGLLTANNSLCARRTRGSPLNKTSDMSLAGTWRINF